MLNSVYFCRKRQYFKKFILIVLCIIVTFSFSSSVFAFPTGSETTLLQIYGFAKYDVNLQNAVYIDGWEDDGKTLTDTKYNVAFESDNDPVDGWVKIRSYDDRTDFSATVTIDLGYKATRMTTFYTRTYQWKKEGILFPITVKYYISKDGESYEYLGEGICDEDPESEKSTAIFRLITEKEQSGRYIKAVFESSGSSVLYINEIAISAKGNIHYANFGDGDILRDHQGLEYEISGHGAKVINFNNHDARTSAYLKPSSESFNTDNTTYTLGQGSENPVTVYCDFISKDQKNYSGAGNGIKYIVIHNTGTTAESTDAERYNYRLHQGDNTSSWHYSVDDNKIYHSLPDTVTGWHSGSTHNYQSIGIEMCVNGAPTTSSGKFIFQGEEYENWVENRFRKTMKNTAMLTAELLTRYGLGTEAVIQHYDVSEKDCPQWLRANSDDGYNGELWLEFMGYVEEYFKLFNGNNEIPLIGKTKNIIIPDYIKLSDGKVLPVISVSDNAFAHSEDITGIVLGNLVKEVGENCFIGCYNLEEIIVPDANKYFYLDNEALYDYNGNLLFSQDSNQIMPPNTGEDCTLDIREINERYCVFTNANQYTVSDIETEYGTSVKSAFDCNGNILKSSDKISTDGTIIFDDGVILYIVSKGDINGDCRITSIDYIITKRIYYGTYSATQRQICSVAFSKGTEVTMTDYILLKRHYFGTYNLMNI